MNNNINYFDNIAFEYGRTGISYYTEDLDEAYDLASKGWKITRTKGFKMIPLEESIVDITDYNKTMQYNDFDLNYGYFIFVKDLYEKKELNIYIDDIINSKKGYYEDFKYFISYGDVLDAEIRISGSDMRIRDLKKDMINKLINKIGFNSKHKESVSKILEQGELDICDRSEKEKMFFQELEKKISLTKKVSVYNKKVFKIYNWDLIEEMNFDVFLFIPFGCFKYLSSFINEKNVEKTMFWEVHGESFKNKEFRLFSKNLKNKKVLIIDKIYSGKTIEIIKDKVKKDGGIPFVMGLNPKNKKNIKQTDYVIILNNVFKSEDLICDENLFKNLYKKILLE